MEWISVHDRMPTSEDVDEFGKVLVYVSLNGVTISGIPFIGGDYWAKITPPKPTADPQQ